jgi:hypothetical protein
MRKSNTWAVISIILIAGSLACRGGGSSTPTPPAPPAPTYSISGTVTLSGAGLYAVTMTLDSGTTATTNASGNFTFSGLANGNYSITPTKLGYKFTPASATITISGASVAGQAFTSTAIASTPFGLRGFNMGGWNPESWANSMSYYIDLALHFAKDEGANMVVMDWAVNFNDDGTMVSRGGPNNPDLRDILVSINKAKTQGFYLVLKPHITLTADPNNRSDWNTNVTAFLPANFFPAWQEYLNNLATLVSASGVDAICIGTENNFIDWQFKDNWVALIKSLRSNFPGALTYDSLLSQWNNIKDIKDVIFWDSLDFIACSGYVTLTQDDNASVDTLRQLFNNNPYGDHHDVMGYLRGISEKYGKQIVTLEGGYQSMNGGLWNVTVNPDNNSILNNDLQARGLEAYLWALNVNKQNWLRGCSIWEASPSLMTPDGLSTIWYTMGFSIHGKPSANVVKNWFTLTQ